MSSAGGLSYHGVIGHGSGKVTLPSVESWGQNMNIVRDPPRSIHTRKIDKVGDTASITQMIQESGDRFCEAINVYARGIDPMVGVSYSNNGTNGGQRVEGQNNTGKRNAGQAFLPYRVMREGAFRPPIVAPQSLLPLSRLPRLSTSAFSKPCFADYTKKGMCPGTDQNTVGVKKTTLKACVRPTAVYRIDAPAVEPFEVKYNIREQTQLAKHSGRKTIGRVTTNVGIPLKEIDHYSSHIEAKTNLGGHRTQRMDLSNTDTTKYLQDPLHSNVVSHLSQNIQITPIDELVDTNVQTREPMNISRESHKTSYTKQDYFHDPIELDRVLPQHDSHTNIGQNIYVQPVEPIHRELEPNRPVTSVMNNIGASGHQVHVTGEDVSSREYKLTPTINAGSFEGKGNLQSFGERNDEYGFDQQKVEMRSRIYEMQNGRINNKNPYL